MPADRAEFALAEACAALGTGCMEHPERAGGVTLEFWVPTARARVAADLLAGLGELDDPEPQDPSWRDAMRAFHTPVRVGDRLLVRPPWTQPVPGLADVVIDPGMAFGTGQHRTTLGCLELMLTIPPGPLVDVGCGSGILAIAARRLGFSPVWAFDNDPLAVEATLDNARVNGVALTVACRDLTRTQPPPAEVMVANLTREVLVRLAATLTHPPRWAVLSGLRPEDVPAVQRAFAAHGYAQVDRRGDDEWVALLVRRPA